MKFITELILIAAAVALTTLIIMNLVFAESCGLPPIPPIPSIGCHRMAPVCICDNQGNCGWEFICVQ